VGNQTNDGQGKEIVTAVEGEKRKKSLAGEDRELHRPGPLIRNSNRKHSRGGIQAKELNQPRRKPGHPSRERPSKADLSTVEARTSGEARSAGKENAGPRPYHEERGGIFLS